MENRIFNKEALEALDDNSEAEEMARIASPKLKIVLGAMIAMVVVAVYWCAFGTINYKVTAQGIVFPFEGEELKSQEAVTQLIRQGRTEERGMLCYVPFEDLRKLKKGQQVQATPADLQRENWGYAYGKVVGIEKYPTTKQEVAERLKLEALAAFIQDNQPIYEVRVVLDEENGNLVWSREKSQGLQINMGTLCNIQVITERKPVWNVLFGTVSNAVEDLTGK
ncbi:MAG: hypothetical protein IK075_06135 [Prevotella sp.]|nr:hypothetical protein [Prevotella sp.]